MFFKVANKAHEYSTILDIDQNPSKLYYNELVKKTLYIVRSLSCMH